MYANLLARALVKTDGLLMRKYGEEIAGFSPSGGMTFLVQTVLEKTVRHLAIAAAAITENAAAIV
jgi:hypothetical protein